MFPLTIASVDTTHYAGEAVSVTCPGTAGELTVLAHHEPLITTLKKGEIVVRSKKGGDVERFLIEHGILEVAHNRVTILL